jgi:outer membrane protein assembly factor BamB
MFHCHIGISIILKEKDKQIMKNFLVVLLSTFLLFSCNNFNKKNNIENNCVSKLFNDSILISKNQDTLINFKNLKNNEVHTVVSKTSNCLQPLLDNNNTLYTPISDELFQCIEIKNIKVKWSFKPPEQINNFKLFGDNLVFSIRNYGLIILDTATGKLKHKLKGFNDSNCHSMLINDFCVENNNLYVSDFRCSNVVCFDIKTGEEIWRYESEVVGATQLLLINDYIFCGVTGNPLKNEGSVVLLDKFSGDVKFKKNEKIDLITKPVIFNNKIIYYSYDSKINEFDIDKFKFKNLISFASSDGICDGQIYLIDDNIYFINCSFELIKFNLKLNKLYKLGKASKNLKAVYKINDEVKFIY